MSTAGSGRGPFISLQGGKDDRVENFLFLNTLQVRNLDDCDSHEALADVVRDVCAAP